MNLYETGYIIVIYFTLEIHSVCVNTHVHSHTYNTHTRMHAHGYISTEVEKELAGLNVDIARDRERQTYRQ